MREGGKIRGNEGRREDKRKKGEGGRDREGI